MLGICDTAGPKKYINCLFYSRLRKHFHCLPRKEILIRMYFLFLLFFGNETKLIVHESKLAFSLTIFWPTVEHFKKTVAIVFPNSPPTSNFVYSCFPSTGRQRLERRSIRPMPYLRERPTHAGNSCFQLQSHEK